MEVNCLLFSIFKGKFSYLYFKKKLSLLFLGSGGKMKDISNTVYKLVQENQEFYKEEETKRVDEKLRPGKPKTESDLFGTEGNFKQLQFD